MPTNRQLGCRERRFRGSSFCMDAGAQHSPSRALPDRRNPTQLPGTGLNRPISARSPTQAMIFGGLPLSLCRMKKVKMQEASWSRHLLAPQPVRRRVSHFKRKNKAAFQIRETATLSLDIGP